MKLRKKILFGLLGIVIAIALFHVYENYAFRQQLQPDAARLIEKYSDDIDIGVDGGPSHEIISVIVTSREFGLYGKPAGKISIFIRDNNLHYFAMEKAKEGDDTVTGQYREIDYYYALKDSKWVNTESSMFSTMESHEPGAKAFKAAGIH